MEAAHIPHGATDGNPQHVRIMRDQYAAVESLFDFVDPVLHPHALFTAHQDYAEAIDTLGREVRVPLRKGAYKKRPNNPSLSDGSIHEYCPPEQVDSEMDRLIEMHLGHHERNVAPEVPLGSPSIPQIHPFQDGGLAL